MLSSASASKSPSSPTLRASFPADFSPFIIIPKSTPAAVRTSATLRVVSTQFWLKDAKSPTYHRYSTGSLVASLIGKSRSLVHFVRFRADSPKEFPCSSRLLRASASSSGICASKTSFLRICRMSCMGSLPTGQTSTHAMHVVQDQTASSEMASCSRSNLVLPLARPAAFWLMK